LNFIAVIVAAFRGGHFFMPQKCLTGDGDNSRQFGGTKLLVAPMDSLASAHRWAMISASWTVGGGVRADSVLGQKLRDREDQQGRQVGEIQAQHATCLQVVDSIQTGTIEISTRLSLARHSCCEVLTVTAKTLLIPG
jgi:hypothetical protein